MMTRAFEGGGDPLGHGEFTATESQSPFPTLDADGVGLGLGDGEGDGLGVGEAAKAGTGTLGSDVKRVTQKNSTGLIRERTKRVQRTKRAKGLRALLWGASGCIRIIVERETGYSTGS